MKTMMTLTLLAIAAVAVATPADAASACLAVKCEQVTVNHHQPTQTNAQTQVCAGNVQVGVALGNQQQCQQTAYQCNVNGEDVETDTFTYRAASKSIADGFGSSSGCNGSSSDAAAFDGVFIAY